METVFSKVVIEADIPRRDAVVQAFKVGDISLIFFIRAHSTVIIACVERVWFVPTACPKIMIVS